MTVPTLQEAIDNAGSPVRLLWKSEPSRWLPPVVPAEFVGWREEQAAAYKTAALSDLSHHMTHLFVEGPDATRLLSDLSANNFHDFAINQAKQLIVANDDGYILNDGILIRDEAEKYILSGVPSAASWIRFHATQGGYDVSLTLDPDSATRGSGDPVLFRYQIQGPRALELVERVFGGPLPRTKFFHATFVMLDGRDFRALRHGMSGQPGYEFLGAWKDGAYVKQAFLDAGESLGLVQVGSLAYSLNGLESGWIPVPTPGIYSAPELGQYRESLSAMSFEGLNPLHGSFFSENIEDYYTTPYELGYGRLISFNHEFKGRRALEAAANNTSRERATLVLDSEQVRDVWGGPELRFESTHGRYRIEANGDLVGVAMCTGSVALPGTILSLAVIDRKYAAPGTEVSFVWGQHPGPGTDPDADLGFARIKATVQPTPYNEFTRTRYRVD